MNIKSAINQLKAQFNTNVNPFWRGFMLGIGTLMIALLLIMPRPTHIGTVNITGIVNGFIKSQAALNLPPKTLQAKVDAFGQSLQTALDKVSHDRHVTLLVQQALVAGAPDYTTLVKAQLEKGA